ncbi:hypothetical protein GcC1_001014 [Golovinomyces cichoracearum]|uniref:Ribosomal protein L34 n=1 Tax=Golovinomyces cichoracearum TaxID=62708 RepID=A0A420J9V9_9PEZI|nr:hypothetical protein GcC1_001014 [Golovinomyces cichoracearum]
MSSTFSFNQGLIAARNTRQIRPVQGRILRRTIRTFTIFTNGSPRPTIHNPTPSSLFLSKKPSLPITPFLPDSMTGLASSYENTSDILPRITSHPAFSAVQIRCGPRNTFNPSHFVRKRRHGFLSRINTRKGRMTIGRRKAKKRSTLSH